MLLVAPWIASISLIFFSSASSFSSCHFLFLTPRSRSSLLLLELPLHINLLYGCVLSTSIVDLSFSSHIYYYIFCFSISLYSSYVLKSQADYWTVHPTHRSEFRILSRKLLAIFHFQYVCIREFRPLRLQSAAACSLLLVLIHGHTSTKGKKAKLTRLTHRYWTQEKCAKIKSKI